MEWVCIQCQVGLSKRFCPVFHFFTESVPISTETVRRFRKRSFYCAERPGIGLDLSACQPSLRLYFPRPPKLSCFIGGATPSFYWGAVKHSEKTFSFSVGHQQHQHLLYRKSLFETPCGLYQSEPKMPILSACRIDFRLGLANPD